MSCHGRREFITLLGGAAAAWPLTARAQQGERMRRIGVLMDATADDAESQARLAAFRQALQSLGWTDDRNVRIDIRWSADNADDIRKHAMELVALAPDAILAGTGGTVPALQRATRSIPIVFAHHRPGRRRLRQELGATRGQHHRLHPVRIHLGRQMAGTAEASGARVDARRCPAGPHYGRRDRAMGRHPGRRGVDRNGVDAYRGARSR